jgi:hypothetical protein
MVSHRVNITFRRIIFLSAKSVAGNVLRVLLLYPVHKNFFYAYNKIVFFDDASGSYFYIQPAG